MHNNIAVLYRKDSGIDWESEIDIAQRYIPCTDSRTCSLLYGKTVIGRYSVLPWYKELEKDLNLVGARLINSFRQHNFIADARNWIEKLEKYTPQTWYRLEDIPENGPFVLKGATNSKKFLWDTHMYAATKQDAIKVYMRLLDDSFISTQDVYIRKYEPLRTYFTAPHGLPITQEYRLFCYKEFFLSGGFYWSNYADEIPAEDKEINMKFWNNVVGFFSRCVAPAVKDCVNFYVVDIGIREDGSPMVIELNDGQMSGLSENNPTELYKNLFRYVNEFGL